MINTVKTKYKKSKLETSYILVNNFKTYGYYIFILQIQNYEDKCMKSGNLTNKLKYYL